MNKVNIVVLFLISILVFSCKNQEKASRKPLEGKKVKYLLSQLDINEFQFETLSAKAEFTLIKGGKKTSFKASVRMRKDSVIWMSITPAFGIEMARILITKDTVKVINRLQKEYFVGDYRYLNKRFNVDLVFDDIQSVLLGNSIAFEADEKLKFSIDNEMYYLGNMKKRKANKADEKPEKIERKKDEVVSLWLDESTFKINRFLLSDLTADRFVKGDYSNHMNVENQLMPKNVEFNIQSEDPAKLNIEYSKVSLNNPLSFSFKISSKYVQIYY
jgi:hypothetical protein